MKPLRTSDIAKAAGVHPNTVRKYEELGYLPKPLRAPNGYRLFTERHLHQVRLIVTLFRCAWLSEAIKEKALETVRLSAADDLEAAHAAAAALLALVVAERNRAELAAELLAGWAGRPVPDSPAGEGMTIKEAAAYLNVTAHTLRNWDRNRLLSVPRHPGSGYRTYGPAELRRLTVIRALRMARYNVMSILNMFRQLEADPETDPRAALESVPPGEADICQSTYRWLSKVKMVEGFAREALEQVTSGRNGQRSAPGP